MMEGSDLHWIILGVILPASEMVWEIAHPINSPLFDIDR